MKNQIENIFEYVLAGAARMREIKAVRQEEIQNGIYVLNQYKKSKTPHEIAHGEISQGIVGREYLLKAVSQTSKRNKEFSKRRR
jgi:DNA-directed RNA polymerase subunit K/omega